MASFFQNDKLKRKSEELKNSLVAIKAILESTNDGILVVNSNKKLEYYNQRFLDIWKLNREFVDSHSDDEAVAEAIKQLKDPEEFLDRLNYFATHPNLDSFDELSFLDGKIFERYGKTLIL
ncbi:PAS domain-containing protein [Legionella gresilensis]|uniref:PAS domain-containing protein n=1 Tax=Legionella gresilensis TaxID=91823 RepID=UPI00104192C2|nr:PAS domain-containing protein [Legionella gresilensis]